MNFIVCLNVRTHGHIRHVLPRYYTFRPNMFQFSSLLSSDEPSVLRKLANIYVILSIRVHFLIHTQNCITLLHHCSRFICCHAILRGKHALVYLCLYVCTQIVNLLPNKLTNLLTTIMTLTFCLLKISESDWRSFKTSF